MILDLIEEAVTAGARRHRACEVAGLDTRTIERWRKRPDGDDLRRGPNTRPANALTDDEEAKIVELATAPEFVGMSPHQLVPKLADLSIFVASESSIYRVLRRRRLLRHRDRSRPRTHCRPRELVATGPNQVWAWDITYLPAGVRGTFWYLYAILDVWSRKLVGWAVHDVQSDALAAELVVDALNMAVGQRQPATVIHHSDQWCQYTSPASGLRCREVGVKPSMGSVGDAHDNAMCESFFATLECELLDRRRFKNQLEARLAVFDFIEGFYNSRRIHSALDYRSPVEYEKNHLKAA